MPCIFVCYRRDDHWAAGNLSRDMREAFGEGQVFRDKEDLRGGNEWRRAIGARLNQESIVLAVIGPLWTDVRGLDGRPKLADRDDPLRTELDTAFAAGATVIPILLDGAKMPQAHDLPSDLRPLLERHAMRWRDDDHATDLACLVGVLRGLGLTQQGTSRRPPAQPPHQEWKRNDSASPVRTRDPIAAAMLSGLIIGVGQLYNNDTKKGVVMFIGALLGLFATAGVGTLGVWLWAMIDAHQVASGKGKRWSA